MNKTHPGKEKIILGIDPGTTVMGYGVLKLIDQKPIFVDMGIIQFSRNEDHYLKLAKIYSSIIDIIEKFLPDEMAIEAPFYGKNVQSMLKLGRAQGVAMAAAISRDIPIAEYAPLKVKMSITGTGRAAKEQVAFMLQKILKIPNEKMTPQLDATDGLAVALCHHYQSQNPTSGSTKYKDWKEYAERNSDKIRK